MLHWVWAIPHLLSPVVKFYTQIKYLQSSLTEQKVSLSKVYYT